MKYGFSINAAVLLFFYNRQNDGKMVKQELKVKLKRQRECFACVRGDYL